MPSFLGSSVGKKIGVAVTGLVMVGFVVGHLIGNLQVFAGPEKINAYAHFLKSTPVLLWGARITLLTAVVGHILFTVQLAHRNKLSRPVPYDSLRPIQATAASRYVIATGGFIAIYVLYHLAHLTWGVAYPGFSKTDVYSNIVVGFLDWRVSSFYMLAMVALGFHLRHGVFSVFQTLGLNHPQLCHLRDWTALLLAVAIPLGYMSIPAAVLIGWVR